MKNMDNFRERNGLHSFKILFESESENNYNKFFCTS